MNVLFSRVFEASVSGWVFYLFAVYTFVIQAVGFSIESGAGYYRARKEIEDGKLVTLLLGWSSIATLIVCLILLLVRLAGAELNYPLSYPLAFIFGNLLISYGNAYLYSGFKFIVPNIIAIIVNLVLATLIFIADRISILSENLISLYFYSYLAHGLILFVIIFITQVEGRLYYRLSFSEIRPLIRFSALAWIANLLMLVLNRVDYFFVRHFCSDEDLGNYIQVAKIAQVFFLLPSMVASVLFPAIASGKTMEISQKVRGMSNRLLLGYSAICLVPALTGAYLFPWLYGESFNKMYIPFLLYIPGILAMSSLYPYSVYFSGTNRIRINLAGTGRAVLFILAADIIFIPLWGINGAAAMSSLGYIVYHVYLRKRFNKDTGL